MDRILVRVQTHEGEILFHSWLLSYAALGPCAPIRGFRRSPAVAVGRVTAPLTFARPPIALPPKSVFHMV
jgi:hypothetical protein